MSGGWGGTLRFIIVCLKHVETVDIQQLRRHVRLTRAIAVYSSFVFLCIPLPPPLIEVKMEFAQVCFPACNVFFLDFLFSNDFSVSKKGNGRQVKGKMKTRKMMLGKRREMMLGREGKE